MELKHVLPAISSKLAHLDREDLLKRLLALELNRFLEYYDTAKDLNINSGGSSSRSEPRERSSRSSDDRSRSSREERSSRDSDDRGRSSREERSSRDSDDRGRLNREERPSRDSDDRGRSNREERSSDRSPRNMNFSRFYINLGEKNKIKVANLIGLINEHMPAKDIEIGKIDILRNFSFFEIDKQFESAVVNAFKDAAFGQTKIVVEVANAAEAPAYETKKEKKKPSERSFGKGFSRYGAEGSYPKKKRKDSSRERKAKKKLR